MKIYDDEVYPDKCKNLINHNKARKRNNPMCKLSNDPPLFSIMGTNLKSKTKKDKYLAYVVVMCSNPHISG